MDNLIILEDGNVLKSAHQFYKAKGFIKVEHVDIDMHFAEDDDFFIKEIDRSKMDNVHIKDYEPK